MRPPFEIFPILKNQRIILREMQDSDIQYLIEISFYNGVPANDLLDAQIINGRIRLDYENGTSIHWIVTCAESGDVLGTCGFYRGFQNNFGEIGYVLNKAYHSKGFMGEAVSLMLRFGWETLNLKGIKAITRVDNQASKNVLKKAGLKLVDTNKGEAVYLIRK